MVKEFHTQVRRRKIPMYILQAMYQEKPKNGKYVGDFENI